MNITRRDWLLGTVGAAAVRGSGKEMKWAGETPGAGAVSASRRGPEFPIVLLELAEKRDVFGTVLCRPAAARLVTVNLEEEDEWGDINSMVVDEGLVLGLGDDDRGYWRITRAFELMEPREDLHEDKFPTAYELSLDALREMLQKIIEERG